MGKKNKRRVVFSKRMSRYELVVQLLSCGEENYTYKLLLPTKITIDEQKLKLDPQSTKQEAMEISDNNCLNDESTNGSDISSKKNEPINEIDPYKQYRPLTRLDKKEIKRKKKEERRIIREENKQKAIQHRIESGQITQEKYDKKEAKKDRHKERAKLKRNAIPIEVQNLMEASKSKIYVNPENQALIQKVKSQNGIYGKLIIYVAYTQTITDFQLILQSAQSIGLTTSVQSTGVVQNELHEYCLKIGDEIIIKDFVNDTTEAKHIMGSKALKHIEKFCFTIIVKSNKRGKYIRRQDILGQNCVLPVRGQLKPALSEFETNYMKDKISIIFKEYIQNTSPDHLVFDTQFTEKERKCFGRMAKQLKLKPMHYGKQDGRKCIISKPFNNRWELIEVLLLKNCETVSYKLLKPTQVF